MSFPVPLADMNRSRRESFVRGRCNREDQALVSQGPADDGHG
jgi:hypothetical protein